MKKIALITASALALGGIGLTTGAHLVHADAATPNVQLQDAKVTPSPRLIVLDTGEFVNPIHIDPYDYELNNMGMGFETGKLEIQYNSKALISIDAGSPRHFTLKLPNEFDTISGKNGGADLKAAITAEYKLPNDSDYTSFSPEDINTSQLGLVDFRLSPTQPINMGSITNIRININYGKILDSLGQDGSFDYKKIIPDSKAGGYTFSGVMSTAEWINLWPGDAATGTTDGSIAAFTAPIINASDITLKVGDDFDPMLNITATDAVDGDITNKITITSNDVDMTSPGTYHITYHVTNSSGLSTDKTITVTVTAK